MAAPGTSVLVGGRRRTRAGRSLVYDAAGKAACCCGGGVGCGCCDRGERCGWVACIPGDVRFTISANYHSPPLLDWYESCCQTVPGEPINMFSDETFRVSSCFAQSTDAVVEFTEDIPHECNPFVPTLHREDGIGGGVFVDLITKTVSLPPFDLPNLWKFGASPRTGQAVQVNIDLNSRLRWLALGGELRDGITTSIVLYRMIDTQEVLGYVQASRFDSSEDQVLSPSISLVERPPCSGLIFFDVSFTLRSIRTHTTACFPDGVSEAVVRAVVAVGVETGPCE